MTSSPVIDPSTVRRVLLVDDAPLVLRSLSRVLLVLHPELEVHTAANGRDALNFLWRMPFDILVTDLDMPFINGVTLLEHVSQRYAQMVRIVHSARLDEVDGEALARLAHRVWAKPVPARQIVDTMKWVLGDYLLAAAEAAVT